LVHADKGQQIKDGTHAVAATQPTKPVFDMLTAVEELRRDGMPSIIPPKNIGDAYLNNEFGWKPLVNDVRSFATAVTQSEKIVSGYIKRSGGKTRRRYDWATHTTTTHDETPAQAFMPTPPLWVINSGLRTRTSTVTTRVEKHFVGSYTYYADVGTTQLDNLRYHASLARKLLGVRITPDVLWNVSPWSWAADWFANTGDLLANASAFQSDSLVMHYGYMTQYQYAENVVGYKTPFKLYSGREISPVQVFHRKMWDRSCASPYGFGVSFPDFTERQTAIVAALGLARGGRGATVAR
jgi:hypothetical protein